MNATAWSSPSASARWSRAPASAARLLDCGGGPGRYAVELARRGYRVTLFDLSEGNLALAREKAAEAGVRWSLSFRARRWTSRATPPPGG